LGEYDIATIAYRQAFDTGRMPWRTMWYLHGAFEAFYQTGQFRTVLDLAWVLQEVTPYIEEANYYRGLVYAAQGHFQDAIFRFDRVLEFNPNFYPAAEAKAAVQNGTFVGPVQTDV
jgi:tetratricopeptide (TPR) repeat protein